MMNMAWPLSIHILAANPHAIPDAIVVCYNASLSATITEDDEGCTPIDHVRGYNVEGLIAFI